MRVDMDDPPFSLPREAPRLTRATSESADWRADVGQRHARGASAVMLFFHTLGYHIIIHPGPSLLRAFRSVSEWVYRATLGDICSKPGMKNACLKLSVCPDIKLPRILAYKISARALIPPVDQPITTELYHVP